MISMLPDIFIKFKIDFRKTKFPINLTATKREAIFRKYDTLYGIRFSSIDKLYTCTLSFQAFNQLIPIFTIESTVKSLFVRITSL